MISDVLMPAETLSVGWGDCDTKTVLLASMVGHLQDTSAVLLLGLKHAFIGVRTQPKRGDRYIEIQGVPYVLIETTAPLKIGQIPPKYWNAIQQKKLEIRPLI